MDNQHTPTSISVIELNERQLAAWEQLKEQLQKVRPNDPQIGYCDRRIVNIKAELKRLNA